MAKDDKSAAAVAEGASNDKPAELLVSLDEFCSRLSESIRSPELIGAFFSVERSAGRMSDLPSVYQSRYDEFINREV